jgi:hypothetical protein
MQQGGERCRRRQGWQSWRKVGKVFGRMEGNGIRDIVGRIFNSGIDIHVDRA